MENIFSKLHVVELSTFVAAPAAARFFADLGADVIKVEAAGGDPLRYTAGNEGRPKGEDENTSFDLENAGKRSIALNLKSPEGKAALMKLIARADVFITNWRQGALERAGLDYETLKKSFPALAYGIVSGYGEVGPDKDLPGFDFTAYFGRGGVLAPLSTKGGTPLNPIAGFGDHQVGLYLAGGLMAALYKAKMTGHGDKVTVSLFHSAIYATGIMLQAAQFGSPLAAYPLSRDEFPNPLQTAHLTKDGRYIQPCMPVYDMYYPRFMNAIGRSDLAADPRYCTQAAVGQRLGEFYELLVHEFSIRTLDEWKDILTKADIPFAAAQLWDEVLEDKQAWASGCLCGLKYESGETRTMVRQPVLFTEAGLPEYKRGPYLGEQTADILSEIGYTPEETADLLSAGLAKGRAK